jgi:hypothetical protein
MTMLLLFLLIPPLAAQAATTNQISQFGITWTFDKQYQCGQFANGDYWVVNPDGGNVVIVDINPKSYDDNGIIRHGTMVNPKSGDMELSLMMRRWQPELPSGWTPSIAIKQRSPMFQMMVL